MRIFDESGNGIQIQARRVAHTLLPLRHGLSPQKPHRRLAQGSTYALIPISSRKLPIHTSDQAFQSIQRPFDKISAILVL